MAQNVAKKPPYELCLAQAERLEQGGDAADDEPTEETLEE